MTQQVYLDDDFPTHPKIVAAGGDAAWLYVCALAYASRHLTRGLIPKQVVRQLSDRRSPARLAKRLLDVGLWHDNGDTYRINDYEVRNAKAIARREKAQNAARTRWTHAPSNAHAPSEHMPGAMPNACLSNALEPRNQGTKEPAAASLWKTHDGDDDSRAALFDQALEILVERRLAANPHVRNPVGYHRSVIQALRTQHFPRLLSDLRHAGIAETPEQLADMLEPPQRPVLRPYDIQRPACDTCDSTGLVELVPGIASRCDSCNPVTA